VCFLHSECFAFQYSGSNCMIEQLLGTTAVNVSNALYVVKCKLIAALPCAFCYFFDNYLTHPNSTISHVDHTALNFEFFCDANLTRTTVNRTLFASCPWTSCASPRGFISTSPSTAACENCVSMYQSSGNQCLPYSTCTTSQYQFAPPTITSNRVCLPLTVCTVDQYQTTAPSVTSDRSCVSLRVCNASQYQTVAPTATSNRQCADLTVCIATEYEAVPASATSNRQCRDIDSCKSYPCSVYATNCTDILNVPDSPAGRTCGACITGYVGNGSVCTEQSVSAIQNLTCFCAAQSGWFKTACGSVDTRLCSTKVSGYEQRRCLLNSTWEAPVSFCEGSS
jgi:hypothetical protein